VYVCVCVLVCVCVCVCVYKVRTKSLPVCVCVTFIPGVWESVTHLHTGPTQIDGCPSHTRHTRARTLTHTLMHTRTHTHIHTHAQIGGCLSYTRALVLKNVHTHVHSNSPSLTRAFMHTHTYTCLRTYTRTHTHTYIRTYKHTHTHAHTHTYACQAHTCIQFRTIQIVAFFHKKTENTKKKMGTASSSATVCIYNYSHNSCHGTNTVHQKERAGVSLI